MHKYAEYTGRRARTEAGRERPFGVAVHDQRIERLEIWATSFNDPGPEYCEFRCFDGDGNLIGTYRIDGY